MANSSLQTLDILPELFALKYSQPFGDQPAQLGKTSFVDGGEIEAGLALHALPERRRYRFLHRGIEINGYQVEAHVTLSRPHPGKVERLAAMQEERSFQVIVSRLVRLDGQIAAVALQQLAQGGKYRCALRLGRLGGGGGGLCFGWCGGRHNRGSIAQPAAAGRKNSLPDEREEKKGAACGRSRQETEILSRRPRRHEDRAPAAQGLRKLPK